MFYGYYLEALKIVLVMF